MNHRICMFVYNACVSDARVLKEAQTLAAAGHSVTVLAVQDGANPDRELRDDFEIIRIQRNPPHYRLLRAGRSARARVRRGARRVRVRAVPFELALARYAELIASGAAAWCRGRSRVKGNADTRSVPKDVNARRVRVTRALALPLFFGLVAGRRVLSELDRSARLFAGLPARAVLAPHKPLMFLDFYWRAARRPEATAATAYHAHDLNTLPVAAWLAVRRRRPLVYDAHELYTEVSTLSERERAAWRCCEGRLIGRADEVITVCDSIAAEFVARYGVGLPTVLLNVPAMGETAAPADPLALRKRADLLESAEPIIIYTGGFSPHRGLLNLVRAAVHLQHGVIVLMGSGRLEPELREEIHALSLEGRVRITAPVPLHDVVAYTAGAAVGVIPYEPHGLNNYYSTPNKLFDYIAAGVAIAGSRLPEIERVVNGAGLGVTFDPTEPKDIARALNNLLADPRRLLEMRGRCQVAARTYAWPREAVKLLGVYERLTDGKSDDVTALSAETRP